MASAIFSVINAVDELFASFLPLVWRISLWGLLAGIVSMALYALASNQEAISRLKTEIKELRSRMLDPALEERSEYAALAAKNLKVSLALLGKVIVPALLSALPVLVIAGWMDTYYVDTLPQGPFNMLPHWASGWTVPYFSSVLVAALAVKLLFRIQ